MIAEEIIKDRNRFATSRVFLTLARPTVLEVTGEDAGEFLQGQFSQELRAGRAPVANYGFWLNQKGRIEGDAVIWREDGGVWRIFTWSLTAAALRERLERYLIADDVTLVDESGDWWAWAVGGPGSVAAMTDGTLADRGWSDAKPVGSESGVVVARGPVIWPAGWTEIGPEEWERVRIASGVVRVPDEVGAEDLPQEARLERVGVSFNKGCYLGQEVMARVQSTGRVRRRLVRVGSVGDLPDAAAETLHQGDRVVGRLRSCVATEAGNWLGWAMISLGAFRSGEPMQLGAGGPPVAWIASEDLEGGA